MLPPSDRRSDYGLSDEMPGERQYDSFVVRLWHDSRPDRLMRAEVRHVQTNLAEAAMDVSPQWLLKAIMAYLNPGPEQATPDVPEGHEDDAGWPPVR